MNILTKESMKIAMLYGGGQIPSANHILGVFAEKLLHLGFEVYGVHKSFLGLTDSSCYERITLKKAREIQKMPGTYLSTCRDVDPANDMYFYKIIENLREKDIHVLIIPGGDGSSRAGRDFVYCARQTGYPIQVIFVPCTIDGIEGSETIGKDPAVKESTRHVVSIIANAWATWRPTYKVPRVAIIEIQGRNRNDIAVGVMDNLINDYINKYNINDVKIIFIPAGHKWKVETLVNKVLAEDKKVAIVVAEGAVPEDIFWDAFTGKGIGQKLETIVKCRKLREANLDVVGYLSQTNNCVSEEEMNKIDEWTSFAIKFMTETDESIAVIKNGEDYTYMSLKEFADGTNSKKAVSLTEEEKAKFKDYLV